MRLVELAPDFVAGKPLLQTIEAAGFEAYFVGGAVRDALLKRPIHDVDIATSAYPAEVKALFKKTVDTGIKHGTVTVLDHGAGYEVTTFRTESTYQDFRRPDSVTFVRSLKEDLKRRDFTVNALAMTADGQIIDLFDGLADLKAKRLKAVGDAHERFHEDALRMMRAVRFEAQLNFKLAPKTRAAIQENHRLLTKIAMERIHSEFIKMMLSPHWAVGLADFISTQLYAATPGLAHQQQALTAILKATGVCVNEAQVWLLLAWQMQWTPDQLQQVLKAWKSANDVITASTTALTLGRQLLALSDQALNWALYQAGALALADAGHVLQMVGQIQPARVQALQQQYAALPLKSPQDLAVNGRDLMAAGVKPGPVLGQQLQHLQKQVLAGTIANEPQALLAALGK
ncbi:MAG: CCA tRNA nucleotidyltransferase [Lactobacillus sp.]|jgi:tRNA nucleotidyltransferase (CCA-adding enzyme)|nr:CCA tRNA nucleotidyltransferase [Lactobacillus sp.]